MARNMPPYLVPTIKDTKACAYNAGRQAAIEHPSCWVCCEHDRILQVKVSELSSAPLLCIYPWHPLEHPDAFELQCTFWKGYKSVSSLCERCKEYGIFRTKMYNDDADLYTAATAAGKKFAQNEKVFLGPDFGKKGENMDDVVVPEINPIKPLLKLEEYEGKRVRFFQTAFFEGYKEHFR